MSEQNPNAPKTPVQGDSADAQNGLPSNPQSPSNPSQGKPLHDARGDADRVKQGAKDALNPAKYAVSAGAAAIGLAGVPEAIGAGNDMKAEADAEKGVTKPSPGQPKAAGRRTASSVPATPPARPKKTPSAPTKTGKLGGGLLSASESDGTAKGDAQDVTKGMKSGAAIGSKFSPVGTAVGAAAGGVIQGLKTKRGRRTAIALWLAPLIVGILAMTLVVGMFVGSVDSSTRPGNDRMTASVAAVVADGIPEGEIDGYASIATSSGMQWQVLPAIKYQRENKGSIGNQSATAGTGPGMTFMTWNVCRDSCSADWGVRGPLIGARVAEQKPAVLSLQEGGWSSGKTTKRDITAATGMKYVLTITKGQHLYVDPAQIEVMAEGRVDVVKPYGGAWARLKDLKSGNQFMATSIHLIAPKGARYDARRGEQIAEIYAQVKANNPDDLPVVYAGDFNSNSSRATDAPADFLKGEGFTNALDLTLQDPVNADYNSSFGRGGAPVGTSGAHVDSFFVAGGVTVNSWSMVFPNPLKGGSVPDPFLTDHAALVTNLTLPAVSGGAAETGTKPGDSPSDDKDAAVAKPVGPFGIDMNQVEELSKSGVTPISEKDAADPYKSAAYLAPLFSSYLYQANASMDNVSLEAGAEYAEATGGGQTRQDGTSGSDTVDTGDLQQSYVAALAALPIEDSEGNAQQIYAVARSWALGNQVCATNVANGFVNDGMWSNALIGPVSGSYGVMRNVGTVPHEGEDLAVPAGTEVHAIGSGTVSQAGTAGSEGGWAGTWVEVTHSDGVKSIYAHLSAVKVTKGQAINAGQVVGLVGNTGNSFGAHLHLQIHINNKREPTNPVNFLKERGVTLGKDKPKVPGQLAGSGDTVQQVDNPAPGDTTAKKDEKKSKKKDDEADPPATDPAAATPVASEPGAPALPQTFKGKLTTGQSVSLKQFQINNAAAIVSEGEKLGLSDKGLVISIMVAMQESTLRNLSNTKNVPGSGDIPNDGDGGDHDSVGLFQQRAGWGSTKDRMTPAYAAQAFLGGPKGPNGGSPRGLLDIDGWEAMSEGKAAQTVQVSAFPDAYDKWLPFAESLVDTVKGNAPMGGTNCEAQATTAVSAGQVAPSEAANVALAAAKAQIGVPYSWGGGNKDGKSKGIGKGANTVGFDCSGLTLFAYAQAGITLPRLSDDQIDIGTKVTKADLSPGDLVFWTGHVAMYVGDGKVIHAPRTGKNVAIVPVSQAHSGAPTGYSRPAGTAAAAPTTPAKA